MAEDAHITAIPIIVMPTVNGGIFVRRKILGAYISQDLLLGRWRQSLDIFGRVFAEDFSGEPGSLINDIAAFPVKEAKFRREMERLRTTQSRDLIMEVCEAASLTPCMLFVNYL